MTTTDIDADDRGTAPTGSYAAAYARLTAIAAKLRAPTSATTIDSLAEDVRSARQAYQLCRARLDAIRHEVDEAIGPMDGADTTFAG